MSGDAPHGGAAAESADPVERAVARARGILPDQGPIGVFIHHNTLHAFQHLPFHEGVQEGARLLDARPYLDLYEYRAAYAAGRIEAVDVDAALARTLGDRDGDALPLGLTRHALWRALLLDVLDEDDAAGLAFRHAQQDRSLPGGRLVGAALERVRRGPHPRRDEDAGIRRHRDALVALDADDSDVPVHGELIRLSYVFLDHGQALAQMPHRSEGFLRAVEHLYADGAAEVGIFAGVRADLLRVLAEDLSAREVMDECLAALGVEGDEIEPVLLATALALPGWTGMFSRLELHPEEHEGDGSVALMDFLAVRLVHERRAVEMACRAAGLPVRWSELRARALAARRGPSLQRDAWVLAGIAEAAGAGPGDVARLSDAELGALWTAVVELPEVRRRQVLHDAYERRYRRQILDGLAALRPHVPPEPDARPDAQYVFCIDEREESLRRAIEELSPRYETFGVAGFFGIAIDYQGLYDHAPAAHCPVVVTPAHEVHEAPNDHELHWHVRRSGLRDRWRTASRLVHRHSRTLGGGAGLSFVLGPLAAALALTRVVAPRSSLALRESAVDRFAPRPGTRLLALRAVDAAGPGPRGKPIGFSLDEAVDRVAGTLRNIGLTERFAPVIFMLGHGSSSLNNPHESAHDCGACGGRRGGANARLFAEFANDPDVRSALGARGLHIPADTWFIGGLHDTSSDDVTLYDLERLPVGHAERFQRAEHALDRARRESAAERCRRFDDAPLGLGPDAALRHVQARASHLAQPRPEYGHCTNAIAVVGRRSLTRGLHLDRRPFLVSYDPRHDENHAILERILAAVGPVGAGISLEYYFSAVDNEKFGSGTKLPHNVTGLIGVMSGHQSDLRTGLPLQMVEIHEPMRLLLVVDATPEALLTVAGRQAEVAELVVNEWVQLVSCHPETGAMMIFADGAFVPYVPSSAPLPRVERSRDWHMQGRGHLAPALVTSALASPSEPAEDPRGLAHV